MKIAIIGLGKMGSALLRGIVRGGLCKAEDIIASDPLLIEEESNQDYYGIRTTRDNQLAIRDADLIILAVKPQVFHSLAASISTGIGDKLVVSIIAGISIDRLARELGSPGRIIRVMPNTPALINEGITALAAGPAVKEEELEQVKRLFESLGEVVEVGEDLMDGVTGLSGSGPAYVYMLIEALADGAVLTGLPRDLALKLAAWTVQGAARMVLETGRHPGELKDMVTSPGGTTIRGVEVLEERGFRSALIAAVKAATERSRELNEL